jgi:succinyl-diaminopimelate desuccinylase
MDVLQLATELIRRPSVTPDDGGCLDFLASVLPEFEPQRFDFNDVKNLWLTHGKGSPVVVMAGHCDVVPSGPVDLWTSPPFEPTIRDEQLFGRGAADMKGSLAAMTIALRDFVASNPNHAGTVALLVTSDEEGLGVDGTDYVLEKLIEAGQNIDYAIVGEPTSESVLGDTIKVGRRGSLSCHMSIMGTQGHVAYPHLANNPIHDATAFLSELVTIEWDQGNTFFQPTTLQISNIHSGTGATNVIPGKLDLDFNLRYTPEIRQSEIAFRVSQLGEKHKLKLNTDWTHSASPFLTENDFLLNALSEAILHVCGSTPKRGTGGGTSDARFFAAKAIPVAEFGPLNATIHAIDERVSIAALRDCVRVFENTLNTLTSFLHR